MMEITTCIHIKLSDQHRFWLFCMLSRDSTLVNHNCLCHYHDFKFGLVISFYSLFVVSFALWLNYRNQLKLLYNFYSHSCKPFCWLCIAKKKVATKEMIDALCFFFILHRKVHNGLQFAVLSSMYPAIMLSFRLSFRQVSA